MYEGSSNRSVAVTNTASTQVANETLTAVRRTQLIIQNTSTAQTITVTKGDQPAVAGAGIVLVSGQTFIEADDGGFRCWQGAVQAISATGAGTLSITETFTNAGRQ